MTDPMLDMSVEAMTAPRADDEVPAPADPWQRRRMETFGASEVPALMVGLGMRAPESVTEHIRKNAKVRVWQVGTTACPRIVAEKARLKKARPLKHSGDNGAESRIFKAWAESIADSSPLDRSTVVHLSSLMPRHLLAPLWDVSCPRLSATFDGVVSDAFGDLVLVEAKAAEVHAMKACGEEFYANGVCPWFWQTQAQAQMACSGASMVLVVNGEGWTYRDGPIHVWPVRRDEAAIAEIRDAVTRGWQMVEEAKREAT